MSEYDDIFDQIANNNQNQNELKHAVQTANYNSIAEILWKVAAKLFCQSVPVLKKRGWLHWIIEELVPVVFHFIKDNWTVFFPYS